MKKGLALNGTAGSFVIQVYSAHSWITDWRWSSADLAALLLTLAALVISAMTFGIQRATFPIDVGLSILVIAAVIAERYGSVEIV